MNFPWKKRDDLIVQRHDTGGWLIKDPVSLQFTLLSSTEFQIFQRLESGTALRSLVNDADRQQYSVRDLESFLKRLIQRQLLYRPDGGESQRLIPSQAARRSPMALVSGLLSWYLPLGNPRPVLDRLAWVTDFAVSRWTIRAAVMIFLLAMFTTVLMWNKLTQDVTNMAASLSTIDVISTVSILLMVKLAHELGHALAARHYGSDCHEMGLLFLLMTPVPYTNVTDTWMLPRRQRMVVTAAGILVELLIAAVSLILWSLAVEGSTRTLLLQTALVCSVNTVLFNGNPLLKFDGYFLLSDWLKIPNLASRSFEELRLRLSGWLRTSDRSSEPKDASATILLVYGILVACYRVVLAFTILEIIHRLMSGQELEVFGWLLKIMVAGSLIAIPLFRSAIVMFASTENEFADSESGHGTPDSTVQNATRHFGPLIRGGVVLCVLAAVCLWPLPARIVCVATVASSEPAVFARMSGRLEMSPASDSAATTEQHPASSDGRLSDWRLLDPDQNLQILRLEAELQIARLDLQISERSGENEGGESLEQKRKRIDSVEQRRDDLRLWRSIHERLVPTNGERVILARHALTSSDTSTVRQRSNSLLSPLNSGAWLDEGTLLGYMDGDNPPTVTAWVSEESVQRLKPGQAARFRLNAGDASAVDCVVQNVSRFPSDLLPLHLTFANQIPGEATEAGLRPLRKHYAVTLEVANHEGARELPLMGIGTAGIAVEPESLASRFYEYLCRTFFSSH